MSAKSKFLELVKINKHKSVSNSKIFCVRAPLTHNVWVGVRKSTVSENNLPGISNWYFSF